MRLSECAAIAGYEVIRDAAFLTPGLLSEPAPEMLVFAESAQVIPKILRTAEASCVIAPPDLAPKLGRVPGLAVAANPRIAFWKLHNHLACETEFYGPNFPNRIHPEARIHPRATVAGRNVSIGAGAVVEAHAVISERCFIGADVVIRSGAVLGSAGFQTARDQDRMIELVHAGGIEIGDATHIFANAVIAPAIFAQRTTIGPHSRVGNLAFVSHNVRTGPRCFIGHGSVINGNVRLGTGVWVGPGAVIANSLSIGDHARISLGAAVGRSVAAGQHVTGSLAVEHRKMLRHLASLD